MTGHRLAAAVLLAFVVIVGWRAVALARTRPFELGRPEYRRPTLAASELEFNHDMDAGTLRVRAGRAAPGHETVGFFKLGPSTFLELRQVTASFEARGGDDPNGPVDWRVDGEVARLGADELVFAEGALLENATGASERCNEIRIGLRSGRVRVR
ncbi:MAG: hypothetical protein KDC98_02790 [Planctomycetes bacterium]|nr:hypothetical protein [Planctomycetota bacterium]